jgi:2-methylcitrate dehydratase PrpD
MMMMMMINVAVAVGESIFFMSSRRCGRRHFGKGTHGTIAAAAAAAAATLKRLHE